MSSLFLFEKPSFHFQIPCRPESNILSELYEEKGEEMGLHDKKISHIESINRPPNPPPPPPHGEFSNSSSPEEKKPSCPPKPQSLNKSQVRDLAARFDAKSAQNKIDFTSIDKIL